MSIAIQTYTKDDLTMKWFSFGKGPRPFVIIPGLSVQSVMGSADAIADAYKDMTDDFTIYVIDRREDVKEGYSLRDMAGDTADLIRGIGLRDINLFGASQGGMIALLIAMEEGDLVKKLVLGSTSSHITGEQFGKIKKWIGLAREKKTEELYLEFGRDIYPEEVFAQYREFFVNTAATVTDEELSKFIIVASAIEGFNVTAELPRIKGPVMVLGAFEDEVLDSDATMEIAEKLDETNEFRLYMYNGYGHAAFDTAPDYRKRIADFLLG